MAYTVLARRYRSSTFDQIVGQEHIAQTLKKAIETGRVAHAYLFCGTRGTGKTSTARILAKALNCLSTPGPTPNPCGKCDSCQSIARGEDIDVIEIDAASNTGVDNVREIIENSRYRPARSRFKVYIIDEVHMLSKSAFNALLKTLEEPPEHVKFILATTEPEKVLPTILSRCQRYDFRNIPSKEIAKHLKDICKQEKIEADEDALALVAKAGAGSMRDSLSLLDRLLSIGEKKLTVKTIEQMLGLPRARLIFDLVNAIGSGDVKSTLQKSDSLISAGLSADALLASLIDHLRNLLIARTCGAEGGLIDAPGLSESDLLKQAQEFEAPILSQDIAILEELRRNLRYNQTGRALLDSTLVRLALAEQFTSVSDLLASVGHNSPRPTASAAAAQKKKLEPLIETPVMRASPTPNEPLPQEPAPVESFSHSTDLPAPAGEPSIQPIGDDDVVTLWPRLMDMLAGQGSSVAAALSMARLEKIDNGQAVVRFQSKGATFAQLWMSNGKRDMIAKALTQIRGQPIGVRFEVDADTDAQTATAIVEPPPPVRQRTWEAPPSPATAPVAAPPPPAAIPAEVESDPLVQSVLREFGGIIVKVE